MKLLASVTSSCMVLSVMLFSCSGLQQNITFYVSLSTPALQQLLILSLFLMTITEFGRVGNYLDIGWCWECDGWMMDELVVITNNLFQSLTVLFKESMNVKF